MAPAGLSAALVVEIIKLNRSLAAILALAAPSLVAFFTLLNVLRADQSVSWNMLLMGNAFIWASFMLPMSLTALSSLMAQMEHSPHSWDYLRALPLPRWTIYAAKALILILLTMFMSLLVPVASAAALTVASWLKPQLAVAAPADIVSSMVLFARIGLAGMLVAALQFWTAMRFSSFVPALALGIGGTFFALVAHSAEAGIYYPWLMPVNMLVTDAGRWGIALLLGAGLGFAAMALAILHLAWREQPC